LLLLGAGSSHSFDVPTMGTFVDNIANSLEEINPKWKLEISNMRESLIAANIKPDIEVILTALSLWTDPEAIENYKAPFLAITGTNILPRHELRELLENTKEQIYKKCLAANIDKAVKAYDRLFRVLRDIGHAEFSTGNGRKLKRLQSTGFDINGIRYNSIVDKIFTTNYDPIIEASIRQMDKTYSDGFDLDNQGDLSFQNRWDQQRDYQLVKLHGSIDYYSKDGGRIVKYALNSGTPDRNIYGEKLERMMILPIGEKYVTKSPYIDLLNKLRSDLLGEEVVIAIGFSFRDIPINNALEERAKIKEPQFQVYVVAPDADYIIEHNLPLAVRKACTSVNVSFDDVNQSMNIISESIFPNNQLTDT
jgi:hypothetical protein